MSDQLLERFENDERLFLEQKEYLLANHPGQYVAIREGEILGYATTKQEMNRIVEEKLGPHASYFVERIVQEAFETPEEQFIFVQDV